MVISGCVATPAKRSTVVVERLQRPRVPSTRHAALVLTPSIDGQPVPVNQILPMVRPAMISATRDAHAVV
jgi:hypothetical protein